MGLVIAYASGCWDLFHVGHLRYLERAKRLCDILVVSINTDEMIMEYKGEPPIIPYKQRWEIIESLRCVDIVIPHTSLEDTTGFDEYGISMKIIGPEFGQHAGQRRVLSEHHKEGIRIVTLSRTPNISTTGIKEAIREGKSVMDNYNDSSPNSSRLWRREVGTPDLCDSSG